MKIESTIKIVVTKEECDTLRKAYTLLSNMANDSVIRHYFNENLSSGYGVEDGRDVLEGIYNLVEVE